MKENPYVVLGSPKYDECVKLLEFPLSSFLQKDSAEPSLMAVVTELKKQEALLNWVENTGSTAFWKRQITFSRLTHHFLPLGARFVLEHSSGASFEVFGPVERLTVETDEDFVPSERGTLALRVYGTVHDANWQNQGRLPPVLHFLFAQEKDKSKTSVVILNASKEEGGKQDDAYRVSELELCPSNSPVDLSLNQSFFFSGEKRSLLLKNDSLRFLYALRAFAKFFSGEAIVRASHSRFVFETQGASLYVTVDGKLERVKSIMASGTFYSSESLLTTSETVKQVTIKLTSGRELSNVEGDWGPDEVVSLVAYTAPPKGGEKMVANFSHFFNQSTLVWENYKSGVGQRFLPISFPNSVFHYFCAFFAVALLVTFVFWVKPSQGLAWNFSRLVMLAGFALVALCVVALQIKLPDDFLVYGVFVLLGLSFVSVLFSLRFSPAVPSGFFLMVVLILLSSFLYKTTRDSFRPFLLIVVLQAGSCLAYETLKLGARARVSAPSQGLCIQSFVTQSFFCFVFFAYFAKTLLKYEVPSCEAVNVRKKWIKDNLPAMKDPKSIALLQAELKEIKCEKAPQEKQWAGFALLGFVLCSFFALPLLPSQAIPASSIRSFPLEVLEGRMIVVISAISAAFVFLKKDEEVPVERVSCRDITALAQSNIMSFTDVSAVFENTNRKRENILADIHNFGCVDREGLAFLAVLFVLGTLWILSLVLPETSVKLSSHSNVLQVLFFSVFMSASLTTAYHKL